jgi:hypothetical protein
VRSSRCRRVMGGGSSRPTMGGWAAGAPPQPWVDGGRGWWCGHGGEAESEVGRRRGGEVRRNNSRSWAPPIWSHIRVVQKIITYSIFAS